MIRAAGVLVQTPEERALFLLRGPGGDYPLTWAFPGGRHEEGESLVECAVREMAEETGFAVESSGLREHTRRISGQQRAPVINGSAPPQADSSDDSTVPTVPTDGEVDFTTYLLRVEGEFTPAVCNEHVGYCWAPITNPPEPLHPGARVALQRGGMDELGVARAMAAGDLVSPQRYQNLTLFCIRITGTGTSYRPTLKEFVWRPPAEYLNPDFLARCAGLPVIWEHPKKTLLNSVEFEKRVVGAIMLAFIRGDEVWGVARIYDTESIADLMAAADDPDGALSTSPGVNFAKGRNRRLTMPEGQIILIEGKPDLVDHLAICGAGVWDKGGEPTGVEVAEAISDTATVPAPIRQPNFRPLALQVAAFELSTRVHAFGPTPARTN